MTFIVDGTTGLTFNDSSTQNVTALNASNINAGTLGKARLPTGSVLQVVFSSSGSPFTTTNNSLAATGLQATITPISTTSKILVLTVNSVYIQQTVSDTGCGVGIARNGSLVFNDSNGFNNFYSSTASGGYNFRNRTPFNYLDSPGTTSSVTYALYLAAYNGQARLNADSQTSTMTLMEIAA